ncbi:MAG: DUF1636 domain-containing protein [Rhodobacteraceae bacterium]|nr:MAG: DUF1636 domain-containing protein [Paracoccaceae bacterium]
MSDILLTLCRSCAPETVPAQLSALESAFVKAGLPVRLRGQECLNSCARPQAMALQGAGRATYVFHAVDPAADIDDIVATVRTYLAAEQGWITDAMACGRLRLCLRARIAAP